MRDAGSGTFIDEAIATETVESEITDQRMRLSGRH